MLNADVALVETLGIHGVYKNEKNRLEPTNDTETQPHVSAGVGAFQSMS